MSSKRKTSCWIMKVPPVGSLPARSGKFDCTIVHILMNLSTAPTVLLIRRKKYVLKKPSIIELAGGLLK
jgi:hypothetical protein